MACYFFCSVMEEYLLCCARILSKLHPGLNCVISRSFATQHARALSSVLSTGLCTAGHVSAVELTRDHSPGREDERRRILAAGGSITQNSAGCKCPLSLSSP